MPGYGEQKKLKNLQVVCLFGLTWPILKAKNYEIVNYTTYRAATPECMAPLYYKVELKEKGGCAYSVDNQHNRH